MAMTMREKLRRLQDEQPPAANETIDEWRRAVDELYRTVRTYLADYERDGLITFDTREVERSEEGLGTYSINMLLLGIGRRVLVFSPEARHDLGGDGRIDIYVQGYVGRRVRLRWTPPPPGLWAISFQAWTSTTGSQVTRPLTKDTLEEALDPLIT